MGQQERWKRQKHTLLSPETDEHQTTSIIDGVCRVFGRIDWPVKGKLNERLWPVQPFF